MIREQLEVLNAADAAKTRWYHFTAFLSAGMGLFTNAYNLFCISTVTKLLGRIYYQNDGSDTPGTLPPNVAAAVNGVAFSGTLSGQLLFGWLGNRMGRKKVYGLTLMLTVVCSIASGLSFGHTAKGVMATLCFFRFWLGLGVGRDNPISPTRGAFIAVVLSMQGFGSLASGIIAIIISTVFKDRFKAPPYSIDPVGSTVPEADHVWRIILIVGALPAALTYYCRMKMLEAAADMSKVLQVEIIEESEEPEKVDQLTKNPAGNFGLFSKEFVRRHGLHLLTWFLLDIAFHCQNLFQKDIFIAIGWIPKAATMNAIEEVFKIALAQTFMALWGTVGYLFSVGLVDVIGPFKIQLVGFFMMAVFMLGLTIPFHHWTTEGNQIGFVVMYGLTFFFADFGPNSITFIVPAEFFQSRLRSTCHGISGVIIGAFVFLYKDTGMGVRSLLFVQLGCNLLGIILTFLIRAQAQREIIGRDVKSLEEMSRENEDDVCQ